MEETKPLMDKEAEKKKVDEAKKEKEEDQAS